MQIGQRKTDRKGSQISQLRGGCKEKGRQRRTQKGRHIRGEREGQRERGAHKEGQSHAERADR